jgi:hypothetical protein
VVGFAFTIYLYRKSLRLASIALVIAACAGVYVWFTVVHRHAGHVEAFADFSNHQMEWNTFRIESEDGFSYSDDFKGGAGTPSERQLRCDRLACQGGTV